MSEKLKKYHITVLWKDSPFMTTYDEAEDADGRYYLASEVDAMMEARGGELHDGQTAKEWAEAWDRENDAWQAMVQHHEELESAVKVFMHNVVEGHGWAEDLNVLDRILKVEGSAPKASSTERDRLRDAVVEKAREAYRNTSPGDWSAGDDLYEALEALADFEKGEK